jgi:monovalent cation/hydrogen antiporter
MANLATVIVLLAIVTALAEVTDKIKIPYPILLVLSGMAIGFFPGLPAIKIDPEVIFLIFLPPILYSAAWTTSWPDFKKAKRPITLLAIGCVLFSTCAVAWISHYFIPGMGWPEAFVLGAIISPPDAIAATAATKGLGVPKRVVTVLEGESLVNDATGLIAYKYAVAAVVTGVFHFWEAGLQFIYVASLGIALGFIVGIAVKWIHKITPHNPTTDTTLTFLTPFIAYLSAEALHVSGVLAVVVCGLYISWNSSEVFSQQTRLQANSSWNTAIFILNGIIFILIGLQLPDIINNLQQHSLAEALKYGFIVSAAVIVGRIIWVYPGAYVPRWISKGIRQREPDTTIGLVSIVAWSGMRGVVSLAAALALPLTIEGSKPFPQRGLIIFITFCVIFSTLILQGLTLRPLIKLLGIKKDGKEREDEENARLTLATSIIEHIEENYAMALSDEVLNQIKTKYEIRIQRLRKDVIQRMIDEKDIIEFHRIQQELLNKERKELLSLRKNGLISDEALRKIEYELDLEETRLILERGVQ